MTFWDEISKGLSMGEVMRELMWGEEEGRRRERVMGAGGYEEPRRQGYIGFI